MQKSRAITTVSSKHQITIPASMCRALGLKEGDKLIATLIDDRIRLRPQPHSYVAEYEGRLKGVYGNEQEIAEYLREERTSWGQEPAAE